MTIIVHFAAKILPYNSMHILKIESRDGDEFGFFLPPFIIQSVHYKTLSIIYVVEPKIPHHLIHVLQSNIPMNILQSYIHISVK